nr:uncharacterized protein LOC117454885 [Pseudochaenichthys georgianus]
MGTFILRFRELYHKWQAREPPAEDIEDELLRTQFIRGLQESLVKQELKRLLRRTPGMTFPAICTEAKALEREQAKDGTETWACRTYAPRPPQTQPPATPLCSLVPPSAQDSQALWDSLRAELQQDLKDQMLTLGKSLMEEMRGQIANLSLGPADSTSVGRRVTPAGSVPDDALDLRIFSLLGRCRASGRGGDPDHTPNKACVDCYSLFQEKFGERLVRGDIPWLTLKAANGLHIPYIGYVLLDFEINGVKDGHQGEAAFRSTLPPAVSTAWGKAFAVCRRVGRVGSPTELQGVAKLPRQSAVLVPPETEMIIWTQVPQAVGTPDCCVMVENLQNDDQEWRVARTLSWVRSGRVPIRVCNPHPFSIEIPQRRALATVSQVDPQAVKTEEELVLTHTGPSAVEVEVRSISSTPVPNVTVPQDHPALALQGEDLNHNEQQRLSDLLQRWTKVFAANEDDFGHTSAVLHQIPTGDAPPIRQASSTSTLC